MSDIHILEFLWYLVYLVVMTAYIALDGFDLGVGILHPFARKDIERRTFLNAIGPVWDGNEVWLVVLAGSLFAGFPKVYATILSAFYTPVMVFLAGLIFRAVAIEFRSKSENIVWRRAWDWVFAIGSFVIAFGLGFVLGNLLQGIPLNQAGNYTGDLAMLANPYSILMGILVVALCMMHGAIYLVMKTEGELHDRLRTWTRRCMIFFIILYVCATMATLIYQPHLADRFRDHPWVFFVAAANILAIANIPRCMNHGWDGWAFISSITAIALLVALYAIGMFPDMIRASNDPAHLSLTVGNSLSSIETLKVLFIIVLIGIPLAIAYLGSVYYLFRGKVKMDTAGY